METRRSWKIVFTMVGVTILVVMTKTLVCDVLARIQHESALPSVDTVITESQERNNVAHAHQAVSRARTLLNPARVAIHPSIVKVMIIEVLVFNDLGYSSKEATHAIHD